MKGVSEPEAVRVSAVTPLFGTTEQLTYFHLLRAKTQGKAML